MPARPPGQELNDREELFCQKYVISLNATKSATEAGYSERSAESTGSRLLRRDKVRARIQELKEERSKRTGFDQDRVLLELEHLAFSKVDDFVSDDAGNITLKEGAHPEAMRAIKSIKRKFYTDRDGKRECVEVNIQLWDKPGTLKLAGRHVGLFPDRVEHTGKDGEPLAAPVFYIPMNGRDSDGGEK